MWTLLKSFPLYNNEPVTPFTTEEVDEAILSLNNNKSAVEYGVTAEHIKFASGTLTGVLTVLFNQILGGR